MLQQILQAGERKKGRKERLRLEQIGIYFFEKG